ncbi:MAG: tetratricopeptide repeat protein [Candidatus Helarchaeota archaeon]
MSTSKKKGILKILNDIKSKTLTKEQLIENLVKLREIGDKSLADDLIPLLDEYDSGDVIFNIRETLARLGITADFMNGEGIKKEDEGDYDGAIKKYELCVKIDPYYQWAYYNLGRMYGDKKKNNEKAIELYKKAVSVNKNYGDGWNNLGNIYSRINQLSYAKEAYEKSIQSVGYKSKHYPYYNLGLIYEKVGNLDKALEHFLKATELKKDYAKALYNAGRIYRKLGEYEKADKYFAEAIKHDETYEQDIRDLGVIVEEVIARQILKKLDTFEIDDEKQEKQVKGSEKGIKLKKHGVR